MDEARVAGVLAELTGTLSPLYATPADALDRARRLLAIALLSGQTEPTSDTVEPKSVVALESLPGETLEQLRRVIHDVSSMPPDPSLRIFSRTWPVLAPGVPQSVPPWAGGWASRKSLGPFESADGRLVWFDIRHTEEMITAVDSVTGRLLFTLPRATLDASPAADVTSLEIPPGSVWLNASLFDSNAPAAACAGVRIRGGSLSLSHPAIVHGTRLTLRPGIVATLQLQLDPGVRAPSGRHGGDSRALDVDPPAEVTFALNVGAGGQLIRSTPASLEAYGNRLRLRPREGAQARFESSLGRLWFPMLADRGSLEIDESHSEILRLRGEAPIQDAGWALPVAIPVAPTTGAGPVVLGEATGAGELGLLLAKGLDAGVYPVESPKGLPLDSTVLLAAQGQLSLSATSTRARYRRVLDVWENATRDRSHVEVRSGDRLLVRLDATAAGGGVEVLSLAALECTARLDRPLTASGRQVAFFSARAALSLMTIGDDVRVFLAAVADAPRDPVSGQIRPQQPISLALSNALVGTSPAMAMLVAGVLGESLQLDRGLLTLHFGVRFLIPSLPDPYAANIARHAPRQLMDPAFSGRSQPLVARVRWAEPARAQLSFALQAGGDLGLSQTLVRFEESPIQHDVRRERDFLSEVESRFRRASGQSQDFLRMLDVSTNADAFGVGISPPLERRGVHPSPLQLQGLDLIAPVGSVSAFTLPAFQWEPVYDLPAEGALPFPPKLVSHTDGGPSRFASPAATLVPVAPLPVIDALLTEYNRAHNTLAARFTLPFGIVAVAEMRHTDDVINLGFGSPRFGTVRPTFAETGVSGGQQLVLRARRPFLAALGGPSPGLPGTAVQTDNATSGFNVLKSGFVDETFNATFADAMKMVPVERVDFSGYGASVLSDWRHPDVQGSGVTQVKFDAIVGRTSREVVQVRSKLYPWGAIVVRIITMERAGSGGVFRRDSGWQAATDATYDLTGCVVHPGVVPRLTNIRRIRDTTNVFERTYPTGTVKLTQVVFDADVEIESVTLGADASRLVPTRDIIGYVQILPIGVDLTAEQLADLLAATGPIGGPIDCELNVAQSGLHMRLARIEVDRTLTLGGNAQFVAVARGTAELASAGQWTFAYRGPSEAEHRRLEANQPIPLIRANPAGGAISPYRFADASALHHVNNPDSEYGLLHASGAQRMLLPQPQLRWMEAAIHAGSSVLFADMYSLAGGVALFPRPDQCHPLPSGSVVRITGRSKVRLEIPPQPGLQVGEFKVGLGERTLAQGATLRVRSRFAPDSTIRLMIDSDQRPDWSCTYGPVTTVGDINDMNDLMQVVGTVSSSAVAKTELADPQMVFGSVLSPVQAIVDLLKAFGLPMPFTVAITNEKYAFKTGVKYTFPEFFPFSAIDDALKHGLGVMLELELSASFGKQDESFSTALSSEMPIVSALTPWTFELEYEGKLLARVVSPFPVFIGGTTKFEIEGTTSGEESKLAFYVGVAGVVEADLKVVEVQGGRSYTIVSRITQEKGQIKLGTGVCSEWEIEGEFLEGLAAVKLSFELIVILERGTEFHAQGEATLAIDVTLAWAFTKTFEVEFTMDEKLAIAAFVAATVLPL